MTKSKSLFQAAGFLLPALFIDIILTLLALSQLYFLLLLLDSAHAHTGMHTVICTCVYIHTTALVHTETVGREEGGKEGRGEVNLINLWIVHKKENVTVKLVIL